MIVIPAIDLKDGEAVRLYKGDYGQKTVYSSRPEEIAKGFERMGAKYLHVVDLDGAKDAQATNKETIKRIRDAIAIPMELGGGIRDMATVKMYLEEIGIDRVILGTAALRDRDFLVAALNAYGPDRIVVGVDIKDGYVSTSGWLETSQIYYLDFIDELVELGVTTIVCTDISKDGTLTGPSMPVYAAIHAHSPINFVVSGGVKDAQDVYDVNDAGYYGCIVGKAFYEGRIDLKEVIANVG
ncbi:MAG: 1-(5-phosphoribosyl)-5-[(5-phosphoribosylamino)methylideneamino]imidazole-4-carboxamide isomerase [Erysipelotrichaceae bacterium]|nr:1-(5-phosphoribosyl)-5-[(5-phosphoribosylamino)methylideneamino]imidazole-4-carboxamide isomerase [Erysipelotrichaceae bacterium]